MSDAQKPLSGDLLLLLLILMVLSGQLGRPHGLMNYTHVITDFYQNSKIGLGLEPIVVSLHKEKQKCMNKEKTQLHL